MQNFHQENAGAGKLVPIDTEIIDDQDNRAPAITGELITSGSVERQPLGPPLYISQSPLGLRVRHRYHSAMNKWEREAIPTDARTWDPERKCPIIMDERWADQLLTKARELGFVIERDDFEKEIHKPKGYRTTWADSLARYIPLEERREVLGEIADVLERHADKGPKVSHAAGQLRKFMQWGA